MSVEPAFLASSPFSPAALLPALLELPDTGLVLCVPVPTATGPGTDLTLAYLNPAAQRLLRLPAQPGTTYQQQFGAFPSDESPWYHHTLRTGEPARTQLRPDPSAPALLVTAQRLDGGLMLSLQAVADPSLMGAESAPAALAANNTGEAGSSPSQPVAEPGLAEGALQASEAKYRTLFDLMDQGFGLAQVLLDEQQRPLDFRWLEINPRFEAMTGLSAAQVLSGSTIRQVVPAIEDAWIQRYAQVALTGEPVQFEDYSPAFGRWFSVYAFRVGLPPTRQVAVFFYDRTEHKQAEEALRASEERFRALVTQSTVGIAEVAADQFTYVNDRFCAITGYSRETLLGQHVHDITHPDDVAPSEILLRRLYETGAPFVVDKRYVRPDQSVVWVLNNVTPIRNAAAQITGAAAVSVEVTDRKRAEEALQHALARTVDILESTTDAFYALDADFRFTYVNQRAARLWGRAADTLLGRHYWTEFPAAISSESYQQHYQVRESGKPVHFETLSPLLGTWIEVNIYPGQQNSLSVFFRDIAEQKRLREALQESELRFRTMADAAPNLVWAVYPDSAVRYINRAFLDFVGLPEEQSYLDTGWGPYIHPAELALTQQTLTQAIAQRSPFVLEHRLRRHDGQYRWLLSQGAPSYYPNGELYGYVGSAIDITDFKQVNEQLTRTNVDLDNFIYTASHDLKAPIANIEGLLRVLEDQLPAPVRAQNDVQPLLTMMQASVERFRHTIAHLTDLSKLQQEQALVPELVDVATVVEDVRRDLEAELEKTGAQLLVDVTACPHVLFSVKNLRSVVYNLFSNALKYRHPDRLPVIEVRCTLTTANMYQLTVHDNGLGLTKAQQQQLFRMFQRLHTHVEGTGIGLYMIKRMVENADGTLTVESEPGVGSVFTVALPA